MPLPGGDPVSSHGIRFSWGDRTMTATSVQFQQAAAAEYDVTSFSSRTVADSGNTCHFLVVKEYDYAVVEPGEVSVEFLANTGVFAMTSDVGFSKLATFEHVSETQNGLLSQSSVTFRITATAFLTTISLNAQVGQYISGNCTFRLSGK